MSVKIDGSVAVVTGAGSGIGRSIAAALASAGASVVAGDIDAVSAAETAAMIGGVAASSSHLTMAWLSAHGARIELLTAAISVENFAGGFAGTALIAWMSSLTSPLFAATQYALLSSLYALPGKVVGGLSGFMVDSFGYTKFFVSTSLIGIPVAVLCLVVWRLAPPEEEPAEGGPAKAGATS